MLFRNYHKLLDPNLGSRIIAAPVHNTYKPDDWGNKIINEMISMIVMIKSMIRFSPCHS